MRINLEDIILKCLVEGVMELPIQTYIHILEYLRPLWNALYGNPDDTDSLKPKIFDIDLKGTKYEELGTLTVNVVPKYYDRRNILRKGIAGGANTEKVDGNWELEINLAPDDFARISSTLEHELLHLIQLQFKELGIDRYGYRSKSTIDSDDPYGHKLPHSQRPVEFQTILNSIIRNLESTYTGGDKKEHFTRNITKILDRRSIDDDNIRKAYLKSVYSYFVNGASINDLKAVNYYYYKYSIM